jgi:hypothetical protein
MEEDSLGAGWTLGSNMSLGRASLELHPADMHPVPATELVTYGQTAPFTICGRIMSNKLPWDRKALEEARNRIHLRCASVAASAAPQFCPPIRCHPAPISWAQRHS